MTQPFDIEALRKDMQASRQAPWVFVEAISPCGQEWLGCGVSREGGDEFIWFEHRPEVDVPTALRIARVPAMEAEILRLTAENERLRVVAKSLLDAVDNWAECAPGSEDEIAATGPMSDAAEAARAALGDAP